MEGDVDVFDCPVPRGLPLPLFSDLVALPGVPSPPSGGSYL